MLMQIFFFLLFMWFSFEWETSERPTAQRSCTLRGGFPNSLLILLQRNRNVTEAGNAFGVDAEGQRAFQFLRTVRDGEGSGQGLAHVSPARHTEAKKSQCHSLPD